MSTASVSWSLANPNGLLINPDKQIWASGRVNAILSLDPNLVLAGTDRGGVWLLNRTDPRMPPLARALSDNWGDPNINALALGPDGPHHVYAAAGPFGSVWETNLSAQEPLFSWQSITTSPRGSLSSGVVSGVVYGIAVSRASRKIVITTDYGVFWADIPTQGGHYDWRKAIWAQSAGTPGGSYFGVAIGKDDVVVVGAWNGGSGSQGILVGSWQGGDLKMRKPQKIDLTGVRVGGVAGTVEAMTAISVASCMAKPENMYALCHTPRGFLGPADVGLNAMAVLRSSDNGETWSPTGKAINGVPPGVNLDLTNAYGLSAGGAFKQICVSPFDPETVALPGFRPFLSAIGGKTWMMLPGLGRFDAQGNYIVSDPDHLHPDVHITYFDPTDPSRKRIYVGSDGGLFNSEDFGNTFDSIFNRSLATLLFQSEPERNLFGEFSVSDNGLLSAGGLQDNGVAYCVMQPNPGPWRSLRGGDGMEALFLHNDLLWETNDGAGIQLARWTGQDLVNVNTIPVKKARPGTTLTGLPTGSTAGVFQARIIAPARRNTDGNLLQVIAGVGSDVYGLFQSTSGLSWEYLGSIPAQIWSIASYDGNQIFLGTTDGRIFLLGTDGSAELTQMSPFVSDKTTIQTPIGVAATVGRLCTWCCRRWRRQDTALFKRIVVG